MRTFIYFILTIIALQSCQTKHVNKTEKQVIIKSAYNAYIGIPNVVNVGVFGYDSVQLFFNNVLLEKNDTDKNSYILYIPINYYAQNPTIQIHKFYKNKVESIANVPININELYPYAAFGTVDGINYSNGDTIPYIYFKVLPGIIGGLLPKDIICGIKNYNYSIIRDNKIVFNTTVKDSPLFSDEIKDFTPYLKNNDMLLINEIIINCPHKNYNNITPIINYISRP